MTELYETFIKRSLALDGQKVFNQDRILVKLKTLDQNWWPHFGTEIKEACENKHSTNEIKKRIKTILTYIDKTLCFCETQEEMHHLLVSFMKKDLEDFKRKKG